MSQLLPLFVHHHHVPSLDDVGDVLTHGGVGANAVLVHEGDKLVLFQKFYRFGHVLGDQRLADREHITDLNRLESRAEK